MKPRIRRRFVVPAVAVATAVVVPAWTLFCHGCSLLTEPEPTPFTVLSYNVQNLFDGVSDGTEYAEFDPSSGHWDVADAEAKARRVARVIRRAVRGGPDVLCLQEVENAAVVAELAENHLSGLGYRYAAVTEVEGAAVQVAVLSRDRLSRVRVHGVPTEDAEKPLRAVLEVRIDVAGEPLYLFANHWKSKAGGAEATSAARRAAAAVLRRRIGRLTAASPAVPVLVSGDLNENSDEFRRVEGAYDTALRTVNAPPEEDAAADALFLSPDPGLVVAQGGGTPSADGSNTMVSGAPPPAAQSAGVQPGADEQSLSEEQSPPPVLYCPWDTSEEPGSYYFRGEWLRIDHHLLSAELLGGQGLRFESFEVVRPTFAMRSDGTPRAALRPGLDGAGAEDEGISDHFPVLLTLERP
ncbi:MAG: endonuclease/exonuclease/phosphatase family protein [Spirochaetaceae bacterium]